MNTDTVEDLESEGSVSSNDTFYRASGLSEADIVLLKSQLPTATESAEEMQNRILLKELDIWHKQVLYNKLADILGV